MDQRYGPWPNGMSSIPPPTPDLKPAPHLFIHRVEKLTLFAFVLMSLLFVFCSCFPHLFFVVLFDSVFDFHSFEDIVGIIFNFPLLLAISLFIVFNQSCETHIDTRVTHQRFWYKICGHWLSNWSILESRYQNVSITKCLD